MKKLKIQYNIFQRRINDKLKNLKNWKYNIIYFREKLIIINNKKLKKLKIQYNIFQWKINDKFKNWKNWKYNIIYFRQNLMIN